MINFSDNVHVISGKRRTGKTTKLLEYIIKWQRENEGKVIITGAHTRWAIHIEKEARRLGIVDLSVVYILNTDLYLLGQHKGLLAIDDFDQIPFGTVYAILMMARTREMDVVFTGDFG